jgi:hypothetical protein
MLLNKRALTRTFCLYSLVYAVAPHATAQQPPLVNAVACPAAIEVTESAVPISGWSANQAKQLRKFERVSIYNSDAGGREFELAPDDQKEQGSRTIQTWNLKEYRTMNVFLRCRYRDTLVVLQMDLPLRIEKCTLRFVANKKGMIVGPSEMECR